MANPDALLLLHGRKASEVADPYEDYLWMPEVEQRASNNGIMTYKAYMRSMTDPNAEQWVSDIDMAYQRILDLGAQTISVVTYSASTWAYLEWANRMRAYDRSLDSLHPSEREMVVHVNPWRSRREKYQKFFLGTSIMELTISELIGDTSDQTRVLVDPHKVPAEGDMSAVDFAKMIGVQPTLLPGLGDLKSAEVAEPILAALGIQE